MDKIKIPEQVKQASVGIDMSGGADGDNQLYSVPFEVDLGPDEIMIVLAAEWVFKQTDYQNVNGYAYLSRKEEDKVPNTAVPTWYTLLGGWQKDKRVFDWFCWHMISQAFATEGGSMNFIDRHYKVYPYPVALIRAPTVLYRNSVAYGNLAITLWYMLQNVTKEELAQLMVKDHA